MNDVVRSKTYVRTWLGRPGRCWEYARTANALKVNGERVHVHQWDGETTVSIAHIKGDAWRKPQDFVTFDRVDVFDPAGFEDNLEAWARRALYKEDAQ